MNHSDYSEHLENMYYFFKTKNTATKKWVEKNLNSKGFQKVFIDLFKQYPHVPPGFIFFVFFVYGINPTTIRQMKCFQKRFTQLGNLNRWKSVDLAFDVNIYIQRQALESNNPEKIERLVTMELVNIERKIKLSRGLPLKGTNAEILSSVVEEITPSRPIWGVKEIMARQIKFTTQ